MDNRILFIGDQPRPIDELMGTLCRLRPQWTFCAANSVAAALDDISRHTVDVVVCYTSGPTGAEFDLIRNLRTNDTTCHIPVLILTDPDNHDLKRRVIDFGVTDLLSRTTDPEDLLDRLHTILRLKSRQDQLQDQNHVLKQEIKNRTLEFEQSQLDIILRLGKASEYRDEETGNHILRVGCYCRAIAEKLDMAGEFVEMLFLTAPLHDIGKIGIPDRVLLKKGKLTAPERTIMEHHCSIGADMLLHEPHGLKPFLQWGHKPIVRSFSNPMLKTASTIALSHHEKFDGTGYPNKLKGADIPLAARITCLADVYDALRSLRPYKPAFSEEKTIDIISQDTGRHFDPMIFDAFETITDVFCSIFEQFSDETSPKNSPLKEYAENH